MSTLLLLEDELPLRDIFRISVEMINPNIKLKEFSVGDSALAHIKANWVDINLYVLDIRVPGDIDGFELAKEIRQLDQSTPIILTSAFIRPAKTELEKFKLIWMAKPWHLMEIPNKIIPLLQS
ncbi:MAG: response regulator [Aggregatilineales bacterium]